jgi:hypothetical protein
LKMPPRCRSRRCCSRGSAQVPLADTTIRVPTER